ncbi:hypothetical protein [Devosia sp. YR412]|uniref:hypothetical protein n=1 Tax=Devosia sp. YR412 TaxID=1881030 RepID=UPI001FCE15BB|nr:hypothetical protein [Devosia sp. YR412]
MGVADEIDVGSPLRDHDDFIWISRAIMAEDVAFIAKTRLNVPGASMQTELLFCLKPLVCEIYFDHLDQVARRHRRDTVGALGPQALHERNPLRRA